MPDVSSDDFLRGYHTPLDPSRTYRTLTFIAASSLFSHVESSALPNVAHYDTKTSYQMFSHKRTTDMRILAATCAAISMITSCVTIYWFYRMKSRFRHRLIMLLIYGDLMKALCLFSLAVVAMSSGDVTTESVFCQCSGFFLQYGTETSDYAVLIIAVHSALQVFRPSQQIRSDGLYPYRYYVYVGAIALPSLMSGLAFLNPHWGYMSQGPFCSLPVRPFWYRLALQWVPRYMIAIIILGLAVAIYAHVGFEFRELSASVRDTRTSISASPRCSMGSMDDAAASNPYLAEDKGSQFGAGSVTVSTGEASSTAPHRTTPSSSHTDFGDPLRTHSTPASFHINPVIETSRPSAIQHIHSTPVVQKSTNTSIYRPSTELASPFSDAPSPRIQQRLDQQRARTIRQLRLLFFYPIIYVLVWLFPFISHCMNYKDEFAEHPIFWLGTVTIICFTLMGTINSLIFSLRERPWRHIPDSDGTFLGSFAWWHTFPLRKRSKDSLESAATHARSENTMSIDARLSTGAYANPATPQMHYDGWKGTVVRPNKSHVAGVIRRSASSSDHHRIQAEEARRRLELEMEDRRAAFAMEAAMDLAKQRRRRTTVSTLETIESPAEEFERRSLVAGEEGRGNSV